MLRSFSQLLLCAGRESKLKGGIHVYVPTSEVQYLDAWALVIRLN